MAASAVFPFLAAYLYVNFPRQWRKDKVLVAVLILWHIAGLASLVMVFTLFRVIRYEGMRYEIARVGSLYYITTIIQTVLFILRYVFKRCARLIAKQRNRDLSRLWGSWLTDKRFHSIVIVLVSFIVYFLGFFNIDFLRDTRYEVSVAAESAEKELNICLIADIHAGSGTWEYTYDDMVEMIDNSKADVLLIAGDVFDETTGAKDVENVAWVLEQIRRPQYGIYYIYGNHDNSIDDWAAEQMRWMGVTVLEDEMTVIGEDIQLIGCLDPEHGAKSLEDLFAQCAPDPDKPVIVMTHRPSHLQKLADLGSDLTVAGHTHGFTIPTCFAASMFSDMYSGCRKYGDMTAVTTSGVSAWGFHYKWPAASEVVSIHVTFGGKEGNP